MVDTTLKLFLFRDTALIRQNRRQRIFNGSHKLLPPLKKFIRLLEF